jgi:pimeloyl-ACP methyl ester carboxylesterase
VPREGHVELPGGASVAWRDWGAASARPVVFLHGTPGSRLFVPQASPPGVRLVTFDRPGYGCSTPLAVPSLSAVAEIVARIADDLGLERFAVAGFSGGGPYALACGALLSDRVSRVAAVSSWGPIDEVEAAYASLTPDERELVSAIRADPEGATRLLWDAGVWYVETPLRFLEAEPEAADEPVLLDAVVHANLVDSNLEGARQGQAGLIGDWVADALPWGFRLADIGVPVDLWIGERDPGRAPLDAREIARRIPSCTVHTDADAGHWLVVSHWPHILEYALAT